MTPTPKPRFRRNTPSAEPQHYVGRKMTEVGSVPTEGIEVAVRRVAFRVKKNRKALGCGSYVLVDERGSVFVLAEDSSTTESLVTKHQKWLVGLYCAGRRPQLPAFGDLLEDIEFALNGRPLQHP